MFSFSAIASEKKADVPPTPSVDALSGYIAEVRKRHGLRRFVDLPGKFRPSFNVSRIAYGNIVQVLNLNGAKLAGMDFENCSLAMASMQNAILANANFRGANLSHADLEAADLTNADFSGADLGSANLFKAVLTGTKFDGANLFETNFDRGRGIDKKELKKLERKTLIFRQLQRLQMAPVK